MQRESACDDGVVTELCTWRELHSLQASSWPSTS